MASCTGLLHGRDCRPTTTICQTCCLLTTSFGNPAFADAAARCACVRDLYGLRSRPEYRTVIYATREGEDALAVADRIAVLHDGRIVQCGTPAEMHDTPVTEHVARLFGRPPAHRSSRA